MSYEILASKLTTLAGLIQQSRSALGGAEMAAAATKLVKEVDKFSKLIDTSKAENDPSVLALKSFLGGADFAKWISLEDLQLVSKKVLLKALTKKRGETISETQARFLKLVLAENKAEEAQSKLSALVQFKKTPKPNTKNEEACLKTIRYLGGLSEDQLELELARLDDEEIRNLARTAVLKVTAKSTRTKLIPDLMRFAKRHAEHTGWQP
jgi:hypothetical protein